MESIAERAGAWPARSGFHLALTSFRSVPNGVLEVAGDLVRGTFGLIQLAFGLFFLISGHLAGGLFYRAFDFFCGSFDVFAVHEKLLFV
jgi:hypothetical protein